MDEFGCDYECKTVGESITKYNIPDDWCAEFDAYDGVYPIIVIQVDQIRKAPAMMVVAISSACFVQFIFVDYYNNVYSISCYRCKNTAFQAVNLQMDGFFSRAFLSLSVKMCYFAIYKKLFLKDYKQHDETNTTIASYLYDGKVGHGSIYTADQHSYHIYRDLQQAGSDE